jgi:transposase InsO family protein
MRFEFIRAERAYFPIVVLCRVLEVTRAGYYAFVSRGPSKRDREDAHLVVAVRAVHTKSKNRYGSPRVHRALRAKGVTVGRNRVARLMRAEGLVARRPRRFCRTTDSAHNLPIAENVLDRSFRADAPNRTWVTDITYVATGEGWLYVAPVIDLFSRRVVGLAMSESIDRQLVLDALGEALRSRRPESGLLHHSDRGSQYASHDYRKALLDAGIVMSMSRRGNCWDNAVAESFFATLKMELVYEMEFATREEAQQAIREYIEVFYNVERLHSSLDYQSPVMFELKAQLIGSAA